MGMRSTHGYKVEAVILDWAGTVVDFGSWAPTAIFVEAFRDACDFKITLKEAREPMGLGKWHHIKALGELPAVASRWMNQFGRPMDDKDVDRIYNTFLPLQKVRVAEYSDPIPGSLDTVEWLRHRGIKIGSCSGYPREVLDVLVEAAARKGYRPDAAVACDDLAPGGRPGPWMALQNMIDLHTSSVKHCIKVDDSLPGIYEGLNAGMWTVGLMLSGNETGMTLSQFNEASEQTKEKCRRIAGQKFRSAGCHYIIDSIADLPEVIQDIEKQL
ncbi:phosphonoacetaldehyde hydrolase [Sansalvadorimonas sp. 2012CJ34-2]|uniref:Phosphonoacetaldehyde hydrolase n=1 Tax=Parendozoicomonas callyspongiae TaxID=2942213 RepID=A0ABT0PKV6_9GAMM|nr:phosphonoacetaldehyde hydrolase [Sansalvadorimonas sp. 2012CJ34-2]MCL6272020.1 phosphonoacetaldehyde hydrolase [Sansalvadorimonas sp. 2012CJ34-2]